MLLQKKINNYYMHRFFLIFAVFSSLSVKAQTVKTNDIRTSEILPTILKPDVKTGNLDFSWPIITSESNSTWEIQGAQKGGDYKTVGILWGTKPGSKICEFKENAKKVGGRFDQYRLLKYAAVTKN